jgi:hypothetical protein
VTVELADLQPDGVDRRIDLGPPRLKRLGRGLQLLDAVTMEALRLLEALLPLEVTLVESLLELSGYTLLDLVDEEFGVGIHVPRAFLESGEMVVVGGVEGSRTESLIPGC